MSPRRTAVAGVVAASALVLGGALVTAQVRVGDTARDPSLADGTSRSAPVPLTVVVQPSTTRPRAGDEGAARWDAGSQTLTVRARQGYSGSCPPIGRAASTPAATGTQPQVRVALEEDPLDVACNDDAQQMTVTVSGLTAAPTELAMTEGGETRVVPVTTTDPRPGGEAAAQGGPRPPGDSEVGAAAAAFAAFAAFARGEAASVPWAESVRFTIAGTPVARVARQDAGDPASWEGCPAPPYGARGVYEGRDCPVSPLRTVQYAEADGPVVVEDRPPRIFGCNYYRAAADSPGPTAWIRPAESSRDCFADFVVSVTVAESGEIVHVDHSVSGP